MRKIAFIILCLLLFAPSVYSEETEQFVYDAHGKRDPFVPLIGDIHMGRTDSDEIVSIEDVVFQGIASDAMGRKVVIVNDEIFKIGDTAGAMLVKSISNKSVIIVIQGKEYDLLLYGEDTIRRE